MPGIELSQLTTLDDRGVDVAGRSPQSFAPPPQSFAPPPQSFAPPPQSFAPAVQASAHSPQALAPRRDAFAPPPDAFADSDDDAPLGVERSTRAIRIQNQWQVERVATQVAAPAAAPAPRPRGPIAGLVVALGLIAAVAIALVMMASR